MSSFAISPGFLTQFSCLGAECEDTCCHGWGMQVDTTTHKRYETQAPELLDVVTGDDGHFVMRRDTKTDYCVKLEGGLCGIQKKWGTDFLSDACYSYPRVTRKIGDAITVTAALSCPEIARLALFSKDTFVSHTSQFERLPLALQDYLPSGLNETQALAIHHLFLDAALNETSSAEHSLIRIFSVMESLPKISVDTWPDAVPFYLQQADKSLPTPEVRDSDPAYLLQALCGLVVAAKKVGNARLMHTIRDIENALHITIRMDTLAIAPLPDSAYAKQTLETRWKTEWQKDYAPILRRYLAAQLSIALFPFGGFGNTPLERIAIIGIRLATIKLALMSACMVSPGPLAQTDVVRVIQSLSRFLDHLAEPEFSLQIYNETGWLKKARLRGLLG